MTARWWCATALFALGCGGDSFVTGDGGGGGDAAPQDGGGGGGDGAPPDGGVLDGCAGAVCGGQCVVLQTNAQNCGACGHVCGANSVCAGGACSVLPAPTQLSDAACLAIDASNVYFTNGRVLNSMAGVFRAPLMGGVPTVMAMGGTLDQPRGIALDQNSVFFTTPTQVWRADKNGNPNAQPIVTTTNNAGAIVADTSSIYWVTMGDGVLWRADKNGQSTTSLTQATGSTRAGMFQSLLLDGPNHMAYWTDPVQGVVARWDLNLSMPTAPTSWVAGQSRPFGIALAGMTLHWANNMAGTLVRGSTAMQTSTQVVSAQTAIHSVATDGANVYYSYQGGVRKVPIAGGNATQVAQAPNATCLAVDNAYVYFMSTNQIWRAPK